MLVCVCFLSAPTFPTKFSNQTLVRRQQQKQAYRIEFSLHVVTKKYQKIWSELGVENKLAAQIMKKFTSNNKKRKDGGESYDGKSAGGKTDCSKIIFHLSPKKSGVLFQQRDIPSPPICVLHYIAVSLNNRCYCRCRGVKRHHTNLQLCASENEIFEELLSIAHFNIHLLI